MSVLKEPTSVRRLPTIMICAVLQGAGLYVLHRAIQSRSWPATDLPWLLACYACLLFVPTTMELLAEHLRERATWGVVLLVAVLSGYFAWFHGARIADAPVRVFAERGAEFAIAFEFSLLWFVAMPFLQARILTGGYAPAYPLFFTLAWRNLLTLAEAGLFTGLFWALLGTWQALFHVLGMDFFRDLFQRPIFIYPVTALAFGTGLHLIGSLDRWIDVVLEQVLGVLKWLGVLAALILVLFTLALLSRVPALVFSGRHAISAGWLLWLVAIVVLFTNAAFRDGSQDEPYPRRLGLALKFTIPLLVVVALVADYSLLERTREYGLTVARFWAWVVGLFALFYAVGYTAAAVTRGRWLGRIGAVNVLAAWLLIAVFLGALTPILSPYRLAAASQYRRALTWQPRRGHSSDWVNGPFQYLRFHAGTYGRMRLDDLAKIEGIANADEVRRLANAARTSTAPWQSRPITPQSTDQSLAALPLFPAARALAPSLRAIVAADAQRETWFQGVAGSVTRPVAGLFVDLTGTGKDAFVVLFPQRAIVYQGDAGVWRRTAVMVNFGPWQDPAKLQSLLAAGQFHGVPRAIEDLAVGTWRYRLSGGD